VRDEQAKEKSSSRELNRGAGRAARRGPPWGGARLIRR
jgi:hypothetical protein